MHSPQQDDNEKRPRNRELCFDDCHSSQHLKPLAYLAYPDTSPNGKTQSAFCSDVSLSTSKINIKHPYFIFANGHINDPRLAITAQMCTEAG